VTALDRLNEYSRTRLSELRELKRQGRKLIGYTPGPYMPEEMVYACGAVPLQLIRGGDPESVAMASNYMVRFVDTFARSQIAYKMSGEDPLYDMIDLLVVPVTDQNVKAIAQSWSFFSDCEVFTYGVPRVRDDLGREYYIESLNLLRQKLEEVTGSKMENAALLDAINVSNRLRDLFRQLSLTRVSGSPPISSRDFVRLNHSSFYLDPSVMIDVLESVLQEVKQQAPRQATGPRILLTGSTLAMGDIKVFDLLDRTEGAIVVEHFDEGLRHYWETVESNGDPLGALADACFMRQVPCAWAWRSRDRLDFIIRLARDFSVDGILWYQLMYRDGVDILGQRFPPILEKELGIPMLKLQSDWDREEKGPFATRIETFVELMEQRRAA